MTGVCDSLGATPDFCRGSGAKRERGQKVGQKDTGYPGCLFLRPVLLHEHLGHAGREGHLGYAGGQTGLIAPQMEKKWGGGIGKGSREELFVPGW